MSVMDDGEVEYIYLILKCTKNIDEELQRAGEI